MRPAVRDHRYVKVVVFDNDATGDMLRRSRHRVCGNQSAQRDQSGGDTGLHLLCGKDGGRQVFRAADLRITRITMAQSAMILIDKPPIGLLRRLVGVCRACDQQPWKHQHPYSHNQPLLCPTSKSGHGIIFRINTSPIR